MFDLLVYTRTRCDTQDTIHTNGTRTPCVGSADLRCDRCCLATLMELVCGEAGVLYYFRLSSGHHTLAKPFFALRYLGCKASALAQPQDTLEYDVSYPTPTVQYCVHAHIHDG